MPGPKLVDPRREPRRGDDLGPDDIPHEGEDADRELDEESERLYAGEEMPIPDEDEDTATAGLPASAEDEPADDDEEEVDVNVAAAEFENDVVPPVPESGLSVEPEDLGTHWLTTATEQGNFESSQGDENGMRIVRVPIKAP